MKTRLILDRVETDYIRSQIDSGDNLRIKSALQTLTKSYRRGVKIHPSQLTGIVNAITGTAYRPTIDEKVRRWVLNSLAMVGSEGMCIPPVLNLISKHQDEPQTIASGIAAVYKLCNKSDPEVILKGIDFDPQMRTLAALQHVPASKLDLKHLPLNIDRASPDLLRLALLVVGLDRSPHNLLNPRYTDSEMVKVLGRHHDPIVSQYTVWAITENDKLHLVNLGLDINNIERYPDNVRSWLFQLLAMEATKAEPYWEYVELGMNDPSAEARRGLALGLRSTFLDLFEPLVMDWVANESDPEVRQHIMNHIVRYADLSPVYEQYAIEIFDSEPSGSFLRQSMEASAVQNPIYSKFRQIGANAPDLFRRSYTVVEKQYNIQNVSAGAVGFDGSTVTNHGSTNIQILSAHQVHIIQAELTKLEAAFNQDATLPAEKKDEALRYILEARQDPSPSKVAKIIEVIGQLGTLAEAGMAFAPYALVLAKAIGL